MLPLDNIKVVDLSARAPGPFCTMVLSDMGAEVLMVEAPPDVDIGLRHAEGPEAEREAAYNPLRRNKRSIALNLKDAAGRELFQELARDADVVVEGFRPGVVDRLGAGYETLRAVNPRLVYCSVSGYGQDGPYRLLPGHDLNYISFAGLQSVIGGADGTPAIPYNLLGDYAAGGLLSAVGILTALWARERTGEGQYIDTSMTDGSLYMIAPIVGAYFNDGVVPLPGRMRLNGGSPDYQHYRCADGRFLSIGSLEDKFWVNLCNALGRPELIPAQHDRNRHGEAIRELQGLFATRSRDEWFDVLADKEIAVGKVYLVDELDADPQLQARGMLTDVAGRDGSRIRHVNVMPRLGGTPGAIRRAGVVPGADTKAILQELGYEDGRIDSLYQSGAVG